MTTSPHTSGTRFEHDWRLHVLCSECLQMAVAPELGGKVVSLLDRRSGRDWLSQASGPRLFRNRPGDDFARSPLCGWDECLPTIAACRWNGRSLPDHGEVWSVPWQVERASAAEIRLSVELSTVPLRFVRTLSLGAATVTACYELENRSDAPQPFLWAMHPLVQPRVGDRVELPAEARRQLPAAPWLDTLDFGPRAPACAKVHCRGLTIGRAAIVNAQNGNGLRWQWNASENDALGIWLTRGGWNGCHHLALEPTNAPVDSLADAVASGCGGSLAPRATKHWTIYLHCESLP